MKKGKDNFNHLYFEFKPGGQRIRKIFTHSNPAKEVYLFIETSGYIKTLAYLGKEYELPALRKEK